MRKYGKTNAKRIAYNSVVRALGSGGNGKLKVQNYSKTNVRGEFGTICRHVRAGVG